MTGDGRHRQLGYGTSRTVNHAEPARSNFGKPDASLRVMRHREDRRLRVRQVVERDVTSDGIEMTYGAACDVAEPDLSVQHHRQAEWSGGNAHARGWYRPGLDSASCRIKSPDAPTHCRRKPEKAPGIELERLRPHDAALHGAEREDAKCLPHRVKAPDVVGSLLNEPGVALRVYLAGHDPVLPIRTFPTRYHRQARARAVPHVRSRGGGPEGAGRCAGGPVGLPHALEEGAPRLLFPRCSA